MATRLKQSRTDDTRPRVGRPPSEGTEVSSEILATGCATMAQLAQLFGTDSKTLPQRLKGIQPARKNRKGYNTYNIREAASMIVTPGYEIEQFIRQMSPQELPPLLGKEYWNGQNARTKYEKEMGNLWPTDRIVEVIGAALNGVRMALLLTKDTVEREADLTDKQRGIIDRIMDGALAECQNQIVESMKEYDVDDFESDSDLPRLEGPDRDEGDDGNILAASDDEEEDIGI